MKRATILISAILVIAGSSTIAGHTARNAYASATSGAPIKNKGDKGFELHQPGDPTDVDLEPNPGWDFEDPNNSTVKHKPGETNSVSVVGDHGEARTKILIFDDWVHTCYPSNEEVHVEAPRVLVGVSPHNLAMYAEPDPGVYVPTNFTATSGVDGKHADVTRYAPCAYPGCTRGGEDVKTNAVWAVKAPVPLDGTVSGFGSDVLAKEDGVYLTAGKYTLSYSAPFEVECINNGCTGGEATNVVWDVYKLSVTNTPYLGIDLTDVGKTTNAIGLAGAVISNDPKNVTISYSWDFQDSKRGMVVDQDAQKGIAHFANSLPSVESVAFEGDCVRCTATLLEKETDTHEPCMTSATASGPVTVVKVDVEWRGRKGYSEEVVEEDEEKVGGYAYEIPDDPTTGKWTEEGTNALVSVRITCLPNDLPTNEMVKVTAPSNTLYVMDKETREYKPAREAYSVKDIGTTEFFFHGHAKSKKYQGDEIEAIHEKSGARDKVKVTVFGRPLLVPDYDRKNGIDDNDVAIAKEGKEIFRFWINDDDDVMGLILHKEGEVEDLQLHKSKEDGNCKNSQVDGISDLVDFTPLWLDVSEVFPEGAAELKNDMEWRLESDCYNVVWTEQIRKKAGDFRDTQLSTCGETFDKPLYKAPVVKLQGLNGVIPKQLMSKMINATGKEDSRGVVMLEGFKSGEKLELIGQSKKSGKDIVRGKLKTRVSPVVDMIRWMNLRGIMSKEEDTGLPSNYENEPQNRPDSECERFDKRHFIFVHGYNINKNEALGWSCEVFKRLWQSGYRGKFTGVDWYGDDTQLNLRIKTICINYWGNVANAFGTASSFKAGYDMLKGNKIVMAHSLGNILTCSAIVDEGMTNCLQRYYMMNAAVPIQALTEKDERNDVMIPMDWKKVGDEFKLSYWYRLFPKEDFRSTLNWIGRFKGLKNVTSFYSATENVVRHDAKIPAWKLQETMKGRYISPIAGDCESGWAINSEYIGWWRKPLSCADLLQEISQDMPEEDKIKEPLFEKFITRRAQLHSLARYSFPEAQKAEGKRLRAQILGCCVPATSLCVGANVLPDGTGVKSVDYSNFRSTSETWPRDGEDWYHSDFIVVAYYYITALYDALQKGTYE